MQLIFVFETTSKAKIDYQYIKGTLDYYYDSSSYKFSALFANGKSNLISMSNKIEELVKKHRDFSEVIICADYDKNDGVQNTKIEKYCLANRFHLVYMNRNIEDVYYGDSHSKNKKLLAHNFLVNRDQILKKLFNLKVNKIIEEVPCTNLLYVIDKLLPDGCKRTNRKC